MHVACMWHACGEITTTPPAWQSMAGSCGAPHTCSPHSRRGQSTKGAGVAKTAHTYHIIHTYTPWPKYNIMVSSQYFFPHLFLPSSPPLANCTTYPFPPTLPPSILLLPTSSSSHLFLSPFPSPPPHLLYAVHDHLPKLLILVLQILHPPRRDLGRTHFVGNLHGSVNQLHNTTGHVKVATLYQTTINLHNI